MLQIKDLTGGYGPSTVLRGVRFDARELEVIAILGRNGTGKTSLMKAIMGLLPRCAGSISLRDEEIGDLPTHQRARRGIGYVPQGRGIFPNVTLEENLRYGLLLAERSMKNPIPQHIWDMFSWMKERTAQKAGTLSGGEQQMLAIARALVGDPTVLLFDEPTEGLAPTMIERVRDLLLEIRDAGKHTIIIVEQNMAFALALASRGYVLEKGQIVAEGDPKHLQGEEIVARHLSI